MIILGINEGHNASAALLVDGRVVAAVSEERLTRRKNEYGFPSRAIAQCLEIEGIEARQVDKVALATKWLPPKYLMTKRNATFSIQDYWREQRQYWYPRIYGNERPAYLDVFRDKIDREGFVYNQSLIRHEDDMEGMLQARIEHLESSLGLLQRQIAVYDHHSCHSYYGYFANPNRSDSTLVYVADGYGDGANGTIWRGQTEGPLLELSRTNRCNIGRMYRYATLILGMSQSEDEYKVMGLAPYANEYVAREAYRIYAETLQVEGLGFKYQVQPKDHFFYFKERLEGLRFDAIAYAIQKWTEELLAEWIGNGVRTTGRSDIVFSGGVALNVKANKKIWELDEVSSLFVASGSGDESLSIGAAYQEWASQPSRKGWAGKAIPPLDNMYLGNEYTDNEIEACLGSSEIRSRYAVRPVECDEIADLLEQGEVVARFANRMEFGPRALGNRSILADPRYPGVIRTINELVKKRDFWMPFTPSVLAEREYDYIVNPKRIDARFMTVAFDSTPLARRQIPAALHPYDFTIRPQVVTRDANPGYHKLLTAFEKRTGVGALLNTSFNLHGEPIVESPRDALSTLARSGLRHLVMGKWLVSKRGED